MGISCFPKLVLAHFFLLFIEHVHSLSSDESFALLDLKAYISPPESQNVLANNWTTATSVCNWIGVICGGQPMRVIALDLSSLGIDGTLPPIADMVNRLPHLKELYLSRNQLYGQIPSSFFNYRRLEVLSLSSNNLTGNIPINLGNLTILKHLDLSSNNLEGHIPSSIGNCTSLEILNFRQNYLEGALPSKIGLVFPHLLELQLRENEFQGTIPSSIFNASKLTLLDLADNSFTGPIPMTIGYLKNLHKLDLGHNQFSSESHTPESSFINALTYNRQLRRIVLSGNPLDTMLPMSIRNLSSSLEYLELTDCKLKGIIPTEVGSLSSLISLKLGNNALTGVIPDTIGCLKNLQSLQLQDNKLNGSIPYDLCLLRNLFELFLGGNELSGAIPECLGNLAALKNLSLSSNRLTSTIPSSLWGLLDILAINLSSNSLQGSISSENINLYHLIEFDLSNNQVVGYIPYSIEALKNLAYLSLAGNRLRGPIPQDLGLSVALEFLDLSHNNLSGVIPESMEALLYLRYFNVSFNELEGEIPSGASFANFTAQSYLMNKALCGAAQLQVQKCPYSRTGKRSRKSSLLLTMILLPVIASISILLLIYRVKKHWLSLIYRVIKHWLSLIYRVIKHCLEKKDPLLITNRTILYREIELATDGFSERNLLGTGGFCFVYKGTMKEEKNVAIKVFNLHLERAMRSFQIESELLTKVHHPNLVKLMNSCCDGDFRALVLEYMPNGTLDKWLYTHNYSLNFQQRLDIMIEVASAISYLHSKHIIHCDLKPSNVLLDEDMVARVSDFSIAQLLDEGRAAVQTRTLATIGYMAPEYGSSGLVSEKADVYSFGILLMETFTGKKPTDDIFNAEMNLWNWICESLPHGVDKLFDATLLQSDQEDTAAKTRCIKSIMKVAWICTAESFSERKTMTEVECKLHRIKSRLQRDTGLIECEEMQRELYPRISFHELKLATDGFSERNLLDTGESSFVYKGTLKDKCVVAIKKFDLQKRGLESFEAHSKVLLGIRHRNVVKILKRCSEVRFKALVLEYMPNGPLQNCLHSGMNFLNFRQRLDIMINVASALSYLHFMHVIHGNLNPTNVLLDKDMVARISGFSFGRCLDKDAAATKTTSIASTYGYMAPELASTGTVSEKSDVYSFGILLMETFTGIRPEEEMNWRSRFFFFQQLTELSPSILSLIHCCTAELPDERKTMTEIESLLVRFKEQFF
ncbi:Detected protein of unknown function [Hibiscus syriacus]|uniref:non-specific serine/threonine protein kinase n=1 Tax=Hibiscus syriacus TaxID=106335 RepID=A0A6A2XFG5_HIBSY|nr:Detected protein of unknown function [Hibiscus syriacus]